MVRLSPTTRVCYGLTRRAGMYLMVFYKCMQVLGAKYTEGRPTAVLLTTALLIFTLVTMVRRTPHTKCGVC